MSFTITVSQRNRQKIKALNLDQTDEGALRGLLPQTEH